MSTNIVISMNQEIDDKGQPGRESRSILLTYSADGPIDDVREMVVTALKGYGLEPTN